jgi:hypothetical protein
MAIKSLGLAAIAIGCSMSVAAAQSAAQPPQAARQEQENLLKTLAAQHAATPTAGVSVSETGSKKGGGTNSALGWNYAHATACGWFVDSGGGQWFYIFPQEGGIIFGINNLYMSQGLQVPCGQGFLIGWHVTNSATGAFDQTESFPFK